MNDYAVQLIQKYRKEGVLIDTNLLLLYVIGTYDPKGVRSSTKTLSFPPNTFDLVDRVINQFDKVITTPYILAEVSNWLAQFPSSDKNKLHPELFDRFAKLIKGFVEIPETSTGIANHSAFCFLGLADTSIVSLGNKYLVLTTDGRLMAYLQKMVLMLSILTTCNKTAVTSYN